MRWRGIVERAIIAVSSLEAHATAFLAAVVEGFSRSAVRARLAATLAAMRLETPPSTAEWGASVVLGLLALATPLAAWAVFDRIILFADPGHGAWTLALLMVATMAFVAGEAGVRYARLLLADRAAAHRETMRGARALSRLAAAPLDGAVEDGAPARAARLEAASAFIELQTGGLRRAVLDLPYAAVAIVAMAWLGGWLALAPLALIAGVFVMLAASTGAALETTRARDAHDARGDDFIAECANHLMMLKAAAMEPFMARRMEQLLASGRDLEGRRLRAAERAEDLTSLLETAAVLAVAALGGVAALQGNIGLGALAASVLLTGAIVRPVVRIAAAAQNAAALAPQIVPDEAAHAAPVMRAASQPSTLRVDAVIEPGGPRLSLEAPFGDMIAFTARDGAALSSTLRALAGLQPPVEGEILLSDVSVQAYRAAHPGAVALVSPRAVLFAGTILENLTLFGQGATEGDALAACDVLGLRPEIDRLPRRLDTMVGQGMTDGLSGSLAHRLCLARAIALSPRLLLLDQPQSRLDPAADRALAAGLAALRGRMTIVLATSRPSYLAMADQAFAIEGARFASLEGRLGVPRSRRAAGQ
ncbi:MAG: ABC transporter ATP-binding protein [Hyphomonadaceae bacterium]|nr:ABC transporter ATP-binding protein [Hyphomonadaceae bacterium]